jgi:hypothetical protein
MQFLQSASLWRFFILFSKNEKSNQPVATPPRPEKPGEAGEPGTQLTKRRLYEKRSSIWNFA